MLVLVLSYLLASSLTHPEIQLWAEHRWLKHHKETMSQEFYHHQLLFISYYLYIDNI